MNFSRVMSPAPSPPSRELSQVFLPIAPNNVSHPTNPLQTSFLKALEPSTIWAHRNLDLTLHRHNHSPRPQSLPIFPQALAPILATRKSKMRILFLTWPIVSRILMLARINCLYCNLLDLQPSHTPPTRFMPFLPGEFYKRSCHRIHASCNRQFC